MTSNWGAKCNPDGEDLWVPELTMEALTEELISLHSTNPAFRQVFASQQTTQLFVNTYKTFVSSIAAVPAVDNQLTIRLLEKLTHFGLALALDNAVAGIFKREVCTCGVCALSIAHLIPRSWILWNPPR